MILDQAHDLRRLVNRNGGEKSPLRAANRPGVLAVVGGKGGAGTTTVALNLAAAFVRSGIKAMVIDADPQGGCAAMYCGIQEHYTIADVLKNRQRIDLAMESGPHGLQLLCGQSGWLCNDPDSLDATQYLLEQLTLPTTRADLIVIDAGSAGGAAAPGLCRHADAVLIVTTTEVAAVVGAFAAIKTLATQTGQPLDKNTAPAFYLLVNRVHTPALAVTIHRRLERACRRILGIPLRLAGYSAMAPPTRHRFAKPTRELNLRPLPVDNVRRVLAAEPLLKWRKTSEFNASPSR